MSTTMSTERTDHSSSKKLCHTSKLRNCTVCKRLKNLDSEIARLQAALQDVIDEKDALQARPGHDHSSIFDRLPAEIMSIIFVFYASKLARKTSPLTLGAVCQKWRKIAWSTPQLWTSLTVSFSSSRGIFSETRLQLAKDWLNRSGKLPLSINIYADSVRGVAEVRLRNLVEVLNRRCDQWHILDFNMPPDVLSLLDASTCVSSKVHKISLSSDSDGFVKNSALSRLSPQIVEVNSIQLVPQTLNWKNVTSCTMAVVAVESILQILRSGPNLRKCHFELVNLDRLHPVEKAYQQLTHSVLETLEIEFSYETAQRLFFDNVTLPGLTRLSIENNMTTLPVDPLVSFLARSSCRLKYLSVDDSNYEEDSLTRVVRQVPSLEELRISGGAPEEQYLRTFCRDLTAQLRTDSPSQDASKDVLLPVLKAFEWCGSESFPWDVLLAILSPLSQEHAKRRRPLKLISVNCAIDDSDSIPYIPQTVFLQLVHDELFGEIYMDLGMDMDGEREDLLKLSAEKVHGKMVML